MGRYGHFVIDADGHGGDLPDWQSRLPKEFAGHWEERKKRIAKGSGTSVQDINRLLKQYMQARQMMKSLGAAGGGRGRMGMPFPFRARR